MESEAAHELWKYRVIVQSNAEQRDDPIMVRITEDDSYKWIHDIQTYIAADETNKLVVYAEKQTCNGILGFYNCLSKELGRENLRYV